MFLNGFNTMRAMKHYKYCIKAEVGLPLDSNGKYQGGDDIYMYTNNPDLNAAWNRMQREYIKREGITPILHDIFYYR